MCDLVFTDDRFMKNFHEKWYSPQNLLHYKKSSAALQTANTTLHVCIFGDVLSS